MLFLTHMTKERIPIRIEGNNSLQGMLSENSGVEGVSTMPLGSEAQRFLDRAVVEPQTARLGEVVVKNDIKSTIGPFFILPEYRIQYTGVVTEALGDLYAEYNRSFRTLVAANREWSTDYQFCMTPDGTPINSWVQIDMVGLPKRFLEASANLSEADVREALRGKIFEIENSLAMYQLLENIFSKGQQDTLFKRKFRASLDELREKHGRQIALMAVTDQKHQAMKESEFGKRAEEPLTDEEVMQLSGFDRFFGPEEFQKYLAENEGECDYLLYARTSDPVAKLRKPSTKVEIPLLEDDRTRRIIKANAITFNVDNPAWESGSPERINDTKAYLEAMGMAYGAGSYEDLNSPEFREYLKSQGIDPFKVESGDARLRAKPMQGAYGCYGHVRGRILEGDFRKDVKRNMRERGPYVIQPEMPTPTIINATDGRAYTYIDRVFFSTDGQNYRYMGGFRSLMPLDSNEAKQGRIHGNGSTVWAEIT